MIHNDVSLNTLIVSLVVAIAGWALKGAMWALGEACKNLVQHLVKTLVKVESLDNKVGELIQAVGDIQKIRTDLNGFYERLKKLEDKKP